MTLSRDEMLRLTEEFYAAMNTKDLDEVLVRMDDSVIDHQLPPEMPQGKAAHEKIVICVAPKPLALRLVRRGYRLAKPATEISLQEIYDVFEGNEGLVDCVARPEDCDRAAECVSREVWCELEAQLRRALAARVGNTGRPNPARPVVPRHAASGPRRR